MRFTPPAPAVWASILLAAGFACNALLMCGAHLVAFGVAAALTLGFRRGALVALGIWLESQILGFSAFGYPHTAPTVAWGAALGAGTVLAAAVAGACAQRGALVAFAAAFASYEIALAGFALGTGSGLSAFAPAIVGQLLAANAAVAAGTFALYRLTALAHAGVAASVPRPRNG